MKRAHSILISLCTFILVIAVFHTVSYVSNINLPIQAVRPSPPQPPRNAYAALLTSTVAGPNTTTEDDLNDVYFISARLLTYQLLYAPETRSANDTPFLILATPDVPRRQLDRLAQDGAIIVPIDYLQEEWIVPASPQWRDVMAKLRVFTLTEYEKILLLDLDTIICKPMDGIFDDPATEFALTLNATAPAPDETPLPLNYTFAGVRNLQSDWHDFPPTVENGDFQFDDYLNAGFFLTRPNIQLFEYYVSLLTLPGRFDPGLPEQALLNYAHRMSGNMPWKPLATTWNANYPLRSDYENGVASMQEKWWAPPRPAEFKDLFLSWRWRMEGFFEAMDAKRC